MSQRPQQRNFVLKAPHDKMPMIRRALNSLTNDNGVAITFEKDDFMEFSSASPAYAMFKIKILSPSSVLREQKNGMEVDIPDKFPEWIENMLSCPNRNCITAQPKEPTRPKFRTVSINPPKIQCYYCGRYVDQSSLEGQLVK